MSVYGMGSMFSSTDEQLKNFVKDGFACIGWRCEDKPELYEILNDIKIGDIIYIKSLYHASKAMKVKAVGIVTSELKRQNTHQGYENCENEIGVKWLNSSINKYIIIYDDRLKERKGSLFAETNKDYIKEIISFI